MYEDHTVEEKYLDHFSEKEKKVFYRQQSRKVQTLLEYEAQLKTLVNSESPAIFGNWEPRPNTALEIKYILNRIAASDPRDISFELGRMDDVPNPQQLTADFVRAFRSNTVCQTVILHDIDLTDREIMPILDVLKDKKLSLLDISGNNIADRTLGKIDQILSNPQVKWGQIILGKVKTNKDQADSLKKYANLSFEPIIRIPRPKNHFNDWMIKHILGREHS